MTVIDKDLLFHPFRTRPTGGPGIEGVREEIAAWEALGGSDPHRLRRAIRHELRRSLHHARRDTKENLQSLNPERWHDWRKVVKRLRYQRDFVAQAQERRPGIYDTRVHRLGSRLGERNDLANLAAFADALLESGDLTAAEHGLVRKAIAEAEKAVVKNCRRLGRLIFLR